jgi:alkanesulfonate monooxygenase SsuD/methylene tetrahydromethanopterin reductase-like flavin-dependent oxidoreductase (luciferase family)
VESLTPSAPAVVALQGGTTQLLPGGRVLVAYGNGGRVEEYDATGALTWRIEGNPGYIFRAQRIRSLYRPGADGAR